MYKPVVDNGGITGDITALVFWTQMNQIEAGGIVDRYIVTVTDVDSGDEVQVSDEIFLVFFM